MDINEIRMRNYRDLLLRFKGMPENKGLPDHGMLKRFSEFTGVSARYFSHINNGRKNIGGKTARTIEEAFGLGRGWFDINHDEQIESASKSESEFLGMALSLYRQSPVEVQALLMQYMLNRGG